MSFAMLPDELAHAAAGLSDRAFRLYVEALAWNSRHLLDLNISRRDVPRLAYGRTYSKAITELVAAGWWIASDDGWIIAGPAARHQWSRDRVENQRTKNAEYQAAHRAKVKEKEAQKSRP